MTIFDHTPQEEREFIQLARSPAVRGLDAFFERRARELESQLANTDDITDIRVLQGRIREARDFLQEIKDARKDTV